MLYIRTHMATVGIRGLRVASVVREKGKVMGNVWCHVVSYRQR